jgi:hypothetical protein
MGDESRLVDGCRRLLRKQGAIPGPGREVTQLVWLTLAAAELGKVRFEAREVAAAKKNFGSMKEAGLRQWLLAECTEILDGLSTADNPTDIGEKIIRKRLNMPAQLSFDLSD